MSAGTVSGTALRAFGERVSLRVDGRTVVVTGALLIALVTVTVITLRTGDYPLPPTEVLKTLMGMGEPSADFVVNTLRLPRVLTAIFVGAALAVSGAIMQRLTRNPLGSPDIIGLTNGSATGALIVIIVQHGSMAQISTGALIGGLATAVVVYLLAYRNGLQGSRFILVGIGISSMLLAANSYLITRASWQDALAAQDWLIGNLNDRGWEQALVVGGALAVLLPIGMYFGRVLLLLEMGDDVARGIGVSVQPTRLVLVTVSVGLVSIATAATGPIAFVALAAPQLLRMLTRAGSAGLLGPAVMGALLLTVSDLAMQRLLSPAQLPVGIATGVIGGGYLIWLLASEWRRGR